MQVLEDVQAGYALLLFDKTFDQTIESLSIRRLPSDVFLGPAGEWTKTRHYFPVEKTSTPDGRPCYRIGPQVVDRLHIYDQIEVSSQDGLITEDGFWEDIPVSGAGQPEAPRPKADLPPRVVSPELVSTSTEETQTGEATIGETPPAIDPPKKGLNLSQDGKPEDYRWLIWASVAAFVGVLAIAGLLAWAFLPHTLACRFLSIGCETPRPPNVLACLTEKETQGQWCSAETCSSGQPPQNSNPVEKAEIARRLSAARQRCVTQKKEQDRQEELERKRREDAERLERQRRSALQQAQEAERNRQSKFDEAQRCAAANPCVAAACFDGFERSYPGDREAKRVLREAGSAHPECQAPTMPNGIYSAIASGGCGHNALQHIRADIHNGRISWQHDAPLSRGGAEVTFRWSGSIDAAGNISASVDGCSTCQATGRIDDDNRDLTLKYPFCEAPVTLTLRQRTSE